MITRQRKQSLPQNTFNFHMIMKFAIVPAIFLLSLALTAEKRRLLHETAVASAVGMLIVRIGNATFASLALLAALTLFLYTVIRYSEVPLIAKRERVASIGAVMVIVTMFTLIVSRSGKGVERYQLDMERDFPSARALKLVSPAVPCSMSDPTCNPQETLSVAAAAIFKNSQDISDQYRQRINAITSQLSEAVKTSSIIQSHDFEDYGILNRLLDGLAPTSRYANKVAKELAAHQQYLNWKLGLIKEHFDFAGYQKLIRKDREAYGLECSQKKWQEAYLSLKELGEANSHFHKKLIEAKEYAGSSKNTLLVLKYGMWALAILVVIVLQPTLRELAPQAPWHCFPVFVLLTGTGLCLLTDLSLNYLARNRFLMLGTASNLLMSFLLLLVVCWLAGRSWFQRLMTAWITHQTRALLFSFLFMIFILFVIIYLVATEGVSRLTAKAYITSELFKALFLFTLSWFATVRSEYISKILSQIGGIAGVRSYLKNWEWIRENLIGFFFLTFITGLGFLLFHDFGPLLVVLVVFAIFIYLVMGATSLAGICFLGGIAVTIVYLSRDWLASVSASATRIFSRLYEFLTPFAFGTGEIGKLIWLRRAGGMLGFGMGKIPYFGYIADPKERIVTPAQIQSDYTVTHLFAQFGSIGATLGLLLYFFWLHTLLKNAATDLNSSISSHDRFLAWIMIFGLIMMEIQALITVCGNLVLMPLTGITLPLVSFGGWSLLLSTFVLALCYSVNKCNE